MRWSLAALGAVTAAVLPATDRDYRRDGRLTTSTATLGWAAYLLHWGNVAAALPGPAALPVPVAPARAAGGVLVVGGAALAAAGTTGFPSLSQFSGTANQELVTSGIYRYSRNPQNVGAGLLLAGAALARRRPLGLAVALAFWPPFLAYARIEERHLERVYGDEYRRYRDRTPRLLGRPAKP